jgi:hypothetical protein
MGIQLSFFVVMIVLFIGLHTTQKELDFFIADMYLYNISLNC